MNQRDILRRERDRLGLTRSGLARDAGLNKNALHNMDSPDWNPTLETIEALERILFGVKEKA